MLYELYNAPQAWSKVIHTLVSIKEVWQRVFNVYRELLRFLWGRAIDAVIRPNI